MKNENEARKIDCLVCSQPMTGAIYFFTFHPSFFICISSFLIKILHIPSQSFTPSFLIFNKFEGLKEMKDKINFFHTACFRKISPSSFQTVLIAALITAAFPKIPSDGTFLPHGGTFFPPAGTFPAFDVIASNT
jgi:hypothetical protein